MWGLGFWRLVGMLELVALEPPYIVCHGNGSLKAAQRPAHRRVRRESRPFAKTVTILQQPGSGDI